MTHPPPHRTEPRLVDWTWVTVGNGARLHGIAEDDPIGDALEDEPFGHGTTLCGRTGDLNVPGIFTRMGVDRCQRCCDRAGYPTGTGSPKNDDRCRDVLTARHETH